MNRCRIRGCNGKVKARRLCPKHWYRWKTYGDPIFLPERPQIEDRLWSKIARVGEDECWEWTASRTGDGYGNIRVNGRSLRAHRLVYELEIGRIPPGLELDHLCRNRACCNPAHLEVVSHQENVLRGASMTAVNARKTHCPQGHPYDEANTWISSVGHRQCRACKKARRPLFVATNFEHGTLYGYNGGRCRCDACHAAMSRNARERYHRKKAAS